MGMWCRMAACGGQRGLTTPTVRAGGAEREKAGLENCQGVVFSTKGLSIKKTQADKTPLLTGRVERTVAWLGTEWKLSQKDKILETRLKREKVIPLRRKRGKRMT